MKVKFLLGAIILLICAAYSNAQTVYITKTGKKYHREDCRYLRYSSYAISLTDAKGRGYAACLVCAPPEKETTGVPQKSRTPSTVAPTVQQKATSSQCTAYTKSGARCKRRTTNASGRCWQHE